MPSSADVLTSSAAALELTPLAAMSANRTIVLFDGVCHFCDSTVQFLLKRDRKKHFVFSPLQSEATDFLRRCYAIPDDMDTVVVIDRGKLFLRSDALLRIAWRLGGLWSLLVVLWVIPRFLRDQAYCLFARHRYRWFGQKDVFMLPTVEQQRRFLVPATSDDSPSSMTNKFVNAIRRRTPSAWRRLLPPSTRAKVEAYRNGQRLAQPLASLIFFIDIVRAVLFQFERWRVSQRAAGVAFFLLIGFVPMVMMLVVATELVGLTDVVGEFVVDAIITNYIPIERSKALETINQWVNNARTTIAGGIGLLAMAFAALNVFNGLYALINDLWQVPIRGRFAHRMGAAFSSLILVPAALFASTWLTARVGGYRIIGPAASRLIAVALIFIIALLGLKLIARAKVQWRSALIAAAVGAVAFELSKTVFAFYVQEMLQGSWFAIYGAIFLFPVFLLWNLVAATIVAATASLGWVIQNPGEAFYDAGIASPYSLELKDPRPRDYDPKTGTFLLSVASRNEAAQHDDLFRPLVDEPQRSSKERDIFDTAAGSSPKET